MNVFAAALATLHADPNTGLAAEFSTDGVAWRAVRVAYAQTSDETGLNLRASAEHVSVETSHFTSAPPARGNRLRFVVRGTLKTYLIKAVDPDILNLSWRLTLSESV